MDLQGRSEEYGVLLEVDNTDQMVFIFVFFSFFFFMVPLSPTLLLPEIYPGVFPTFFFVFFSPLCSLLVLIIAFVYFLTLMLRYKPRKYFVNSRMSSLLKHKIVFYGVISWELICQWMNDFRSSLNTDLTSLGWGSFFLACHRLTCVVLTNRFQLL